MANFIKLTAAQNHRVDELSSRLTRIEIHLRRGELRAAHARILGFYEDAEGLLRDLDLPLEFILAGANVGALSGKGSLVRGRLPAALLGAVAGWMVGQASVLKQERFIGELVRRVQEIELLLEEAARVQTPNV